MKHGDISNQVKATIAFRVEDLFNVKEDSALNRILTRFKSGEINKNMYDFMYYLYRHTDMTVNLIIPKSLYKGKLKRQFDDMPFNRLLLITKETEIRQKLLTGEITFYVDNNEERRERMNSKFAVSLEYIKAMI